MLKQVRMNTLSIDSSSLTKSLLQELQGNMDKWPTYEVVYGSNWSEDEDGNYKLTLKMPGIDKKDAKFTIQQSILTVEGESDEYKYHQKWSLPKGTDVSKCTASIKNGIAKVTLPKLESQKPIQINIQ